MSCDFRSGKVISITNCYIQHTYLLIVITHVFELMCFCVQLEDCAVQLYKKTASEAGADLASYLQTDDDNSHDVTDRCLLYLFSIFNIASLLK